MNYNKYKKMIYSRAWYYAKRFKQTDHIQDIIAQGNFLFADAIHRYNSEKGSFSTFLWYRLNKLKDYIKKYYLNIYSDSLEKHSVYSEEFERFKAVLEFYDEANKELSNEAKMVLDYILQGWVGRKPGLSTIKRWFCSYLGYSIQVIDAAWEEIKNFWKKEDFSERSCF